MQIDFRVQAAGVEEKALGKLAALVRHDVQITIMSSPEADGTQEQLPDTKPSNKSVAPDPGPPPEAGDIFAETHAPASVVAARAVLKAKLGSKAPPKTLKAKMKVAAKKAAKKG